MEVDAKVAHEVMDVNFFGTFYGSRAAVAVMAKKKQGIIINIISDSALVGRPRSLIYAPSKWAVRGFTEGLRISGGSPNPAFRDRLSSGGTKRI